MRRIIYPGSFDPVHHGHLQIAQVSAEKLKADQVIFLLSPATVWKYIGTSYEHRLNMLKLALDNNKRFEISTIEAKNEGKTNYTFDTIVKLKALYPDDELMLLLGADQVNLFHKWRNPDELANLVQIVCYKRPGLRLNHANLKRYRIKVVAGPKRATSSTAIRNFDSIDTSVSVLDYIITNKLYFANHIGKFLSTKRFAHSYEVAKLARLIAIANDKDDLLAFKAGMLHDLAKEVPQTKMVELMNKHYPEFTDLNAWAYHQFIGEFMAKEEFGITNRLILNAIKYHATGSKQMKWLAKIIYAADKIEPTRKFDSSELINACMEDYKQGFKITLHANKMFLSSKNKDIDNYLSQGCFNKYL